MRFIRTILITLFAAGLLTGCRDKSVPSDGGSSDSKTDNVVRSRVERGPLRVTVEVDPKNARLSDEPTLVVTIDSEQDVEFNRPPFGEALGDFLIRDFREPLPEISGNRQIVRQVYTLEPTRAGKLSIAPITITFRDTRAEGDGKVHSVETEALTIDVSTVLGDDVPSLADLRPASGPVELPESASHAMWWLAGGCAAALAVAALAWLWLRRQHSPVELQLSPIEMAYLELERLIEQNLAATDVKLFYVELTGVVRRYIERTTGVRAAEQTTEEFLREISGRADFSVLERDRLQQFLVSADLVKFAAQQPNKQDIEESFDRAKAFIGTTGSDQTEEVAA